MNPVKIVKGKESDRLLALWMLVARDFGRLPLFGAAGPRTPVCLANGRDEVFEEILCRTWKQIPQLIR